MPAQGKTGRRGYGNQHQKLRRQIAPKVEAGGIICPKCNQPIDPGTPWDLGHTDDRNGYTGPEHTSCNRGHARKTQLANAPKDFRNVDTSREW